MNIANALYEIVYGCREVLNGRRALKRIAVMPTQLTFIATKKCNSRCIMCNIWQDKSTKDPEIEDIRRAFKSPLFKNLRYGQISGGEVLLREDVVEIVSAMVQGCPRLAKLGIASNGLSPQLYVRRLRRICELHHDRLKAINLILSVDGIGKVHDGIRGVPGAYERVMETVKEVERLRREYPRLYIRVNSVMQPANADQLMEIWRHFRERGIYVSFSHLTRDESFFRNLHSECLSGNGAEEKICGFIDEISRIDFKRMPYYRVIRERLDGVPHRDLCTFGYTGVYVGCDLKVFPCWQGEGREIGSLFDDDIVEKWFSEDAREKVLATRREHCEQCLVERHKNMFVNVREYCRHPLRFIGLALMHVVRRH